MKCRYAVEGTRGRPKDDVSFQEFSEIVKLSQIGYSRNSHIWDISLCHIFRYPISYILTHMIRIITAIITALVIHMQNATDSYFTPRRSLVWSLEAHRLIATPCIFGAEHHTQHRKEPHLSDTPPPQDGFQNH